MTRASEPNAGQAIAAPRFDPSRGQPFPDRMRLFADPAAEVVWAGLMTLDVALQHQVLRELASRVAIALASNPKTPDEKIEAAVAALHEAFELRGRSPSVRDYTELRASRPELDLPPESSIRAWLGAGWADCLRRSLLPTPSDGDFAYPAIEHRFTLEEIVELVLACAADLQRYPSHDLFRAWARRPDVAARYPRRPFSDVPYRRYGGWTGVLTEACKVAAERGLETPLLKTTPRVYAYARSEMVAALVETTSRLRERVGDRSPRQSEYEGERTRIQEESIAAGAPRALPNSDLISMSLGGGSWDGALVAAGLTPLGGSGTKSHRPQRRKTAPRYRREDKEEALRQAWAELNDGPFLRERYVLWRKDKLAAASAQVEHAESDRADSAARVDRPLAIPSADEIEKEWGGWRQACAEVLPGYQPPVRRWHKRPDPESPDAKAGIQ